jgi:hypothetical protein
MSHGPSGLDRPADCTNDLQAVINMTGSVNASASIITRPILVFMFIIFIFLSYSSKQDFRSGSLPVTAAEN